MVKMGRKHTGLPDDLLVDTQGLVLIAKVHRANVTDRDGIKLLLGPVASTGLPRLSHLWLDAGYTGQGDRGAGWVQRRSWDGAPRSLGTPRSWLRRR
jgi:hypothetical protein